MLAFVARTSPREVESRTGARRLSGNGGQFRRAAAHPWVPIRQMPGYEHFEVGVAIPASRIAFDLLRAQKRTLEEEVRWRIAR